MPKPSLHPCPGGWGLPKGVQTSPLNQLMCREEWAAVRHDSVTHCPTAAAWSRSSSVNKGAVKKRKKVLMQSEKECYMGCKAFLFSLRAFCSCPDILFFFSENLVFRGSTGHGGTVWLPTRDNWDGCGEHEHCAALLVQLQQQNPSEGRKNKSQQEFSAELV